MKIAMDDPSIYTLTQTATRTAEIYSHGQNTVSVKWRPPTSGPNTLVIYHGKTAETVFFAHFGAACDYAANGE